jgi:IstB-like ATP binding protein
MPIGLVCCSTARSPIAAISALPPGCAMPDYATMLSSRTSIIARLSGLDRALFHKLAGGEWIEANDNLILGPAGVGKSWLACALGHKACPRQPFRALSAHPQVVRRTGNGAR